MGCRGDLATDQFFGFENGNGFWGVEGGGQGGGERGKDMDEVVHK
jgi:hypothetical protein